MKNVKTIFCLISLLVAGITNVWGTKYTHNYSANIQGSFDTSTKTLTITGTGQIPDLATAGTNYYDDHNSDIEKVVIGEGITWVGRYILQDYTNLTSITFPSTLTRIRNYNFDKSKKIVEIHASSPNQWAQVEIFASSGHPFGKITDVTAAVKAARSYYFNGSNTATTELVFEYGLTNIQAYTFCNAGTLVSVSIPGSITSIGDYALYSKFAKAYVNKATAPTLATTTSISFTDAGVLYVPTGASGYTTDNYWKYYASKNTQGAKTVTTKPVSGDGTVDGQSWSLSERGVLTITGSGALSTTFADADGASQYPYYYFRYLVDTVVVTGGITALSNILQRCEAMKEINIDQAKVPTASATLPTLIHGGTIAVKIKPAALASASASNLASAPWDSNKLCIHVTIDQDSTNNTAILTNCSTYVKNPVNVQLTRSTFSPLYYNTFCSPVSMTESEIKTLFGDTTHLVEFVNAVVEDDTLQLNFDDATAIVAGKPYLIKPEKSITNPRFTGITPTALATSGEIVPGTDASFYGILDPLAITDKWAEGKKFIFLLAENKFTYATGGTLKGMRAYFLLGDDVEPSVLAHSPKMRINYEAEEGQTPTAIDKTQTEVKAEKVMENGVMYIIKNGVKYSVMGQIIK